MKDTRQLARTSFRFALLMASCAAAARARGDVKPLPAAPDVPPSAQFQVFIDDREVPVGAEVSGSRPIATAAFLSSGHVEVRVVVLPRFSKCTISPIRLAIVDSARITTAQNHGKEIRFSLEAPRKLIVQADDLPPLALLGSTPDDDAPPATDANVIYFGPGVHHPGRIRLKSGQTVVLAAGAKVFGTIEGSCVENVRVTGRGHLYGTEHTSWTKRTYGLIFDRCRNVTVENIGIRDCNWWTTEFVLCDQVKINDINLNSFNQNNGGLMVDSCSRLTARNSLLMTMDDCICPHALNAAGNGEEPSEDLLFENLLLYNVATGNGIRIGASLETREANNWMFRNIDVVQRRGAAIYSDHSDWATVRNLVFENVSDESAHGNAVDMFIAKTHYSCQTGYRDERGAFDGLYFVNVRSQGGKFAFRGQDEEHGFRNVVLDRCRIGVKPITSRDEVAANQFVAGLQFKPAEARPVLPEAEVPHNQSEPQPPSPPWLILDDGEPGFQSFGFVDKHVPAAYGGRARLGHAADAFSKFAAAVYEPHIAGHYEILVHCGDAEGVDENAPWIIKHRDGYARRYVNQNHHPGWHSLGEFHLDADANVRLVYPDYFQPHPTGKPVIADAVKFVRVAGD